MDVIRVVTTEAVFNELVAMSGVAHDRSFHPCPAFRAVTPDLLARFFVCAAMVLGNSDALMLALIVQSVDDDSAAYCLPGLELYGAGS